MTDLALKAITYVAVALAIFVSSWFASKAHYDAQYVALKAATIQQAKDEQKTEDTIIAKNTMVAKEVNDAAIAQISSMSGTIASLLRKPAGTNRVQVCAPASSSGTVNAPIGPAVTAGDRPSASDAPAVAVDPQEYALALDTAIDSLKAQLLWRQWARDINSP
jgi:hypothetical protein